MSYVLTDCWQLNFVMATRVAIFGPIIMTHRLSTTALLLLIGLLPAAAQDPPSRLFVESHLHGVAYSGDRVWQGEPGWAGLTDRTGIGYSFGLGVRLFRGFTVTTSWLHGTYPGSSDPQAGLPFLDPDTSPETRNSILFEGRQRLFEFGPMEASFTGGWASLRARFNDSVRWGSGPVLGGGLSIPLGAVSLSALARLQWSIPAQAADKAGEDLSPDLLPSLGVGVRMRPPVRKPRISSADMDSPGRLTAGKEGVFSVQTDLDPMDVTVEWTFNGADPATGHSVRHAFENPGTYPVEAVVSTERTTLRLSALVEVVRMVESPKVLSVQISPVAPLDQDTLRFSAEYAGTDAHCTWDFGDGRTSAKCAPWHVYEMSGTYRVILTVSNSVGSDSATRTIRVREDACRFFDTVADVYYRRNSQELALEMREVLRENFALAARCPDRILVLSGHALDTERNADELALERARAAMQYYLNLGLSSSKIRLGRAVIHDADSWEGEVWRGRRASTLLVKD